MKKYLLIGMVFLILFLIICGCIDQNNNKPNDENNDNSEINIGDTITIGNMRYTFRWASWTQFGFDGGYIYQINILGENLGGEVITASIKATRLIDEEGKTLYPNYGESASWVNMDPGRKYDRTLSPLYNKEKDLININDIVKIYMLIEGKQIILNDN